MSGIVKLLFFILISNFFFTSALGETDTSYLVNKTGRIIYVTNMTFFLKGSFPLIIPANSSNDFKVFIPYPECYTTINLSLGNGEFSDFFLQPGITYNMLLDNKGQINLQATGTKVSSRELNFFNELSLATGTLNFYKIKAPSWKNIKERHFFIESLYANRLTFLETYCNKYQVSDQFKSLASLFLKSRFIVELFQMRVPNDEIKKEVNIFYKDSVKQYIRTFSNDDAMGIMEVRYASYLLFQAYRFEENDRNLDIFFDSLVNGKMKDFLIGKYLVEKMNNAAVKFTGDYSNQISEIKDDYIRSIVSEYSNVSVINLEKDTAGVYLIDAGLKRISFNDVISKSKAKFYYIDFWASWCGPCIKEMPNSIILRKQFENNADIAFLYISVDEDYQNWLTALEQSKIKGYKFSYKVSDESNFSLIKMLKISSYPRYLVINRDGQILVPDAKRPSNPAVVAELKQILAAK